MKKENDITNEESAEPKTKKAKVEEVTQREKTCIKCGNTILEDDEFCFKCGWNQNNPLPVKKQKKSGGFSVIKFFFTLVILLLFFAGGLYIWRYFEGSKDNISYSNKNVTIEDTGIADAVEKVYDSVVVVENYSNGTLYGTGSGFVYKTDDSHGYILTNNHVITNASQIKVKYTNGETDNADVVGNDEFSDVAVLKVPKKNIKQVAEIADNSKMRIGDTTFAVGAPLDSKTYSWSVTRGILSGKDRLVSSGTSYMKVLQTDTPINAGNSGGPLCNANGEVIGITNMKLASEQIEGMGFAIPIETAIGYADGFIKGDKVDRPYIGVSIYDAAESFFNPTTHVVVGSVEEGSAADKAGIKKDDIILKVEGEEVENSSYFKYKLYSYKVGETIKITVKRDNKEIDLKVKLQSNTGKKA